MSIGIACLLEDEEGRAGSLAAELSRLNEERRGIERRMQSEAVEIAAGERFAGGGEESVGLCLYDETWHQGVIGLVAGRVKDRLHRPVIAFARAEDGALRGSARSIPGVHIRDALDAVATKHPGLISRFGGHAMAAGLSLPPGNLEVFRRAFAAEIAARADVAALDGVLDSDGELAAAEISVETARALRNAGPWGQGFPEPLFDGHFLVIETRIVGEQHLKLSLGAAGEGAIGAGATGEGAIEAIAFGFLAAQAPRALPSAGARVHVAYRLEVNDYGGLERAQLNCQHLKVE
jgi:single-stranded-DNA-specific exonuclease